MIYLLRASHANEFELQNYKGIKNLHIITSHHPLTDLSLPSTKLWSPTDLPRFSFRRQIFNRLFGGEQWLLGLEKYILSERYHDLNHDIALHTAETYTPYTHQAVQLRKQGKISKLICTCWETIPHNNEKFMRLRNWKAEAYKYVDVFHTPTCRAKDALIAEGVDPKKIIVIPYGVDLTRFHPMPLRSIAKRGRRPLILTVARPVYEKGIDIYYKVSRQLASVADFRLVSDVKYSQMPSIYQSADLFFLPSRTTPTWEEQYGMALIEAMACGLPVITSNSGAIPEVVGNAGITHPVCDVDKMVKTIKGLLADPDQIHKHSKRSRARAVKLYDARKVSTKLAKLYL